MATCKYHAYSCIASFSNPCTSLAPWIAAICTHSALLLPGFPPLQAQTYPCVHQRGLSPQLPTFLSLYLLLPSPSYLPFYLSQSPECRRWGPSLSSCCIPSPGLGVSGQGWRGQGEEELLGLCESSLSPSPLGKAITLPRLWFLTKVLQSRLSGFFFPPLSETPPDVWCIFPGYALLVLGCFVVIVACSH